MVSDYMDIILNILVGLIVISLCYMVVLIYKMFDMLVDFKTNYKKIIFYSFILISISFIIGTIVQIIICGLYE